MKSTLLKKKTCLITGSTGGIGQELALKFAKEGSNLFLTSTNIAKLTCLKESLQKDYKNITITCFEADLSSEQSIRLLLLFIQKNKLSIDILINNAGSFVVKEFDALTVNDFNKSFNINVIAPFILAQELSKNMKKNNWGRIINIGSSSSYGASKSTMAYAASKHALLGITKALQEELSEFNIRSYIISPAGTQTKMGKKIPNQNFESFLHPQEIAEYISFIIKFDSTLVSNEVRLNRMSYV